MTNSITTAKCPSVLSSGNYGMTQNRYTDESKEYIFVKLTDSAYRALEEYQRNENNKRFSNGQRPKIQVNGNSGVIYFPTLDNNEARKFGFTIDDVEGSLECIQQTPQGLDVLGSMSYRMRIHANDDIYDTTRTKMAIAEETEKSKCIREIKPNQTDIGRKVKKPVSSLHHHIGNSGNSNSNSNINSSSSSLSNSINRNKLVSLNSSPPLNGSSSIGGGSSKLGTSSSSSRSPNPSLLGGSGTVNSGSNNNNNNRYGSHTSANLYSQNNVSQSLPSLTSASSLSSTLAGGIANGYASAAHNSPTELSTSATSGGLGGGGGGGGSNNNNNMGSSKSRLSNNNSNFVGGMAGARGSSFSSSKMGGNGKSSGSGSNASSGGGGSKLPDISRRKIRERLIHLLALRPFKKPELYARLQNEGLRDRERSLISNVLKDIATLSRDNTYNLRRQMWNDVNENWPYYSEQELQQLKRRKPQNLTPPLSSDAGSSTSGQSPTSTHTGSPPPLVGGSGGGIGNGLKRTSLEGDRYDEAFMNRVQPKKQRISHFKKDAIAASAAVISSGGGGGTSSGLITGRQYNRGKNAATYSPQGCHSTQADENSGNSDLSFNVLSNVDDIISNMEQSNYYGSGSLTTQMGGGRKSNATNGNGSNNKLTNLKENRHSSSSNSSISVSPKNIYNGQELESSSKLVMKKTSNLPVSPPPYNVNFVPESSKSSSSNGSSSRNGSGNGNNTSSSGMHRHQSPNLVQQQQHHQQQQPQQQQHHKTSSSSTYSPKEQVQTASPRDEFNSMTAKSGSGKGQTSGRSSANKIVRTPTPPSMQEHTAQQQQHYSHQRHYQQPQTQQTHSSYMQSPSGAPVPAPASASLQMQYHPSVQEQATISPTMPQITSTAPEAQFYDFSGYTRITSIEQRRQYKTEFERDYGEYHQLRERMEGVRRNFELLAEQLHRVPQGCPDYEAIKQQIVVEYERINNEEEPKRDKQRFDYLHAKLAHIKQLVTDYDKTLTSMAAAAAAQQQLQQQQQNQQQYPIMHCADGNLVDNNVLAATARVSPMVSSESNHSPPNYQPQQQQRHQQQQLSQIQPQQLSSSQTNHHQHHDAETIQKKHYYPAMEQYTPPQEHTVPSNNTNDHNSNSATQYEYQQQQQRQQQQQMYNGHNAMHMAESSHTQSGRHHQQQLYNSNSNSNNNNKNNGNDSDSDDSSDSNSNDDDDEDESNDDSNSNDDDEDDDDANNDH